MALYPKITLTNEGLNMIGESQGSTQLIFTKAVLGDGQLSENEDIKKLTTLKHAVMDVPIQGFLNQGNGQVRLRFAVSNANLTTGFFAREIGVYAKLGIGGTEKLYAYTNGGNLTDYIPDKNTPTDSQILDLYIIIGNASNVNVLIDDSTVYSTKKDLQEHNNDRNAHANLNADTVDGKHASDFVLKAEAAGVGIGTILPFLATRAQPGWLAVDTGAIVSRATYPDLWAWVQTNAPLISETEWQTQAAAQSSVGAYSSGDGSTTFRLPRLVDFVSGTDVGRTVGTWRPDDYKSHTHNAPTSIGNVSNTSNGQMYMVGSGTTLPIQSSGGSETRPKSISMLYCVKAFDAQINQGMVDITALANSIASKLDKSDRGYGTKVWVSADYAMAYGTPLIVAHNIPNLDITRARAEILAKCINANNGYDVGDVLSAFDAGYVSGYSAAMHVGLSTTTIFTNTTQSTLLYLRHKTGVTAFQAAIGTDWKVFFRIWY